MKVFISWSGPRSKGVAEALHEYIPYILNGVEPWVSSELPAGSRWTAELSTQLAEARAGILCLTPHNLTSPWLLFEAGCIAKTVERVRVIPYLTDLKTTDVDFPLAMFQGVEATRDGTLDLFKSLNDEAGESALPSQRLSKMFDKWWPELHDKLKAIPAEDQGSAPPRSERDLLEELVRSTRQQAMFERWKMPGAVEPTVRRVGVRAIVYSHDEGFAHEDASRYCLTLERAGVPVTLIRHRDPSPPDALFFGALVDVEDARTVINSLPYEPRFLFPPDYPTHQGGDESGLTIGIGLISRHYATHRGERAEPVAVTGDEVAGLVASGVSNAEFQHRLRRLTWDT